MAGRVVRGRPAGGRAARGRAALPACCASPSGFYAQQAAVRAGQVLLVDVVEIAVEIAVEQGDVNKSLLLRVAVAAADNGGPARGIGPEGFPGRGEPGGAGGGPPPPDRQGQ